MRNALPLILALVMCLFLCACGVNMAETSESTPESITEVPPEPELITNWDVGQIVDEFGDVVADSNSYITSPISGNFSNTATTDSDLDGYIFLVPDENNLHYSVCFRLFEYENHIVTYLPSDEENIILKTKVGDTITEYQLTGSSPNGDLILSNRDLEYYGADTFFETLYNGDDIRCIIYIGTSQYNFTVESSNFAIFCDEHGFLRPGSTIINNYLGTWEYVSGDALAFSRILTDTSKHSETNKILISLEGNGISITGVDTDAEINLSIGHSYDYIVSHTDLNQSEGYAVEIDVDISEQGTLIVTTKYYKGEKNTPAMSLYSLLSLQGITSVCEYTKE